MDCLKEAVRVLRAAGDATRIRILAALGVRPLCVCELVSLVDVGQPAVSRHLSLLEAAGLVESVRDGRWVDYRLCEDAESAFAKGILREVRALTACDEKAAEIVERARAVDRLTLRASVRDRCVPEPTDKQG